MREVIRRFKAKANEKFLIVSHQNLEGDAIGSQLALAELLEHLGKEVILISPEEIPENYRFLPGAKKVRYKTNKRQR